MATRPPSERGERGARPMVDRVVDLNADLGEEVTDDAALLAVVTSASVACGYHAGTVAVMRAVCEEAVRRGVVLGAHVSYADRKQFGRVARDVDPGTLREQVADQVGTLAEVARAAGAEVAYLKPHGALYHRVLRDPEQAAATLAGSGDLPVLTMPGECADQARALGRLVGLEGFPDRRYRPDGRLVDRSGPDPTVHGVEEVVAQALVLATRVDSVCLHGDSPGAVAHAGAVRAGLVGAGWRLAPVVSSR